MITIEREKLEQVLEAINKTREYQQGYAFAVTAAKDIAEALAQPAQEPRNFCPRCGKRTADLTVIHTCTPPEGGHQ